jgi:hypothetical protein
MRSRSTQGKRPKLSKNIKDKFTPDFTPDHVFKNRMHKLCFLLCLANPHDTGFAGGANKSEGIWLHHQPRSHRLDIVAAAVLGEVGSDQSDIDRQSLHDPYTSDRNDKGLTD